MHILSSCNLHAMIYELHLIPKGDGLYDLYVNEKLYRNVTRDRASDLIFENDEDFLEPDQPLKHKWRCS